MNKNKFSKYLALVLRHKPQELGIEINNKGWTSLSNLIQKLNEKKYIKVSRKDIEDIVKEDKKGRYSIKGDAIRANQGHSLDHVNPTDEIPKNPPKYLYHGTTLERYRGGIKKEGILPMSRHHVHMYDEYQPALDRSKRLRGTPVVLRIHSESMKNEEHEFYVSENNVWLSKKIPAKYIELIKEE